MKEMIAEGKPDRVYFSLGDKEARTRNKILAGFVYRSDSMINWPHRYILMRPIFLNAV